MTRLQIMASAGLMMAATWAGCIGPHPAPLTSNGPTCVDACARARQLGCRIAEPTPAGQSCEQICELAASWPLACMALAVDCGSPC